MTKKEVYIKSRDVAYVLDISPDDVVEMARHNILPAEKVGRYWQYPLSAVLKCKDRLKKKKRSKKAGK